MSEKRTDSADLSKLRINRDDDSNPNQANSKNKTFIFAGLLVVGFIFVIYLFTSNSTSTPSLQVVTVSTIYPSQADAILTASGYVVAQTQAAIASKGTGRLEYLHVEEGDDVKEGEIIARLEHDDVDAELQRARADLEVSTFSNAVSTGIRL